jgi:hypothetical protein
MNGISDRSSSQTKKPAAGPRFGKKKFLQHVATLNVKHSHQKIFSCNAYFLSRCCLGCALPVQLLMTSQRQSKCVSEIRFLKEFRCRGRSVQLTAQSHQMSAVFFAFFSAQEGVSFEHACPTLPMRAHSQGLGHPRRICGHCGGRRTGVSHGKAGRRGKPSISRGERSSRVVRIGTFAAAAAATRQWRRAQMPRRPQPAGPEHPPAPDTKGRAFRRNLCAPPTTQGCGELVPARQFAGRAPAARRARVELRWQKGGTLHLR